MQASAKYISDNIHRRPQAEKKLIGEMMTWAKPAQGPGYKQLAEIRQAVADHVQLRSLSRDEVVEALEGSSVGPSWHD